MKKDLVVKTNRLNQAFQVLSLAEFHIVQLAIVDARDTGTGLTTDMPLRIDALRYADVFGTTRQNAYMRMKEAEETLFNRRFSFFDEDGKLVKSRWISQVKYLDNEGAIEIVFTPAVVQGISRINGVKEFFTQYLLSQTAQLKSVYSSRLYELLIQWRSTEKTPIINLEDFRAQLGIEENQYKLMSDFKKRVLDLAINDINEKTDIKVTYQQHKKGRSISGFSFNFKQKKSAAKSLENKRDLDTIDHFSKMTDKQCHLFANKLSELPEMSKYSQGTESYQQFAIRIAEMLQDSEKFKELIPLLKKVGFQ
ncbi:TPA: replication initiation protein RepM [Acinetobacter baumannii]|uniref:replication initiation protein RepM n=1 Tax=Acinetobacter baumannii TaxID=470 RepID=UPI002148F74E|nr:replication initiation protein RepM [Acinetobacter baumannii]MCR0009276.1 replication initiation protein RepM [Acinetobacter baumannii]HAV3582402.1 replication initiation protein [Acinetobacter baumannii]